MKQVIVVNASLGLPKGKLAAQVAHAAVSAMLASGREAREQWLREGMPKVVVRADTEFVLARLERQAHDARIPAALIHDAGRTVVPEGTVTCLGLGPAEDDEIDRLTGELKLQN